MIHFAAFKAVGESVAEPLRYYRNNLESFINILEAARSQGGCNVLFSSSATVYGVADTLPVTEQTPRQPATSPYGNTKQICEGHPEGLRAGLRRRQGHSPALFQPPSAPIRQR